MDSFVLGWRAMWWGRVWSSVIILAGGWSFELDETARTNTLPGLTCSN